MHGNYVAVGAPLLGRTYVLDARTGAVADTLPSGGWDLAGPPERERERALYLGCCIARDRAS